MDARNIRYPCEVSSALAEESSSTGTKDERCYANPEAQVTSAGHQENVQRKGLPALPGCIFQLKLLMLFLKRGVDLNYSFELGTEIEIAEKFDDLVLEITKEDNQKEYRLFQSKHKENESEKISFRNLLSENKGPYRLEKYFYSYKEAKNAELFRQGKIKDVTICTNIHFNFKSNLNMLKNFHGQLTIRDAVTKIENSDNILDIESITSNKKSVRYRFNQKIAPLLKQALLINLSEKLAHCFLNKKPIKREDEVFKHYHGVLAKEVIDTNNKNFFVKFVDGSSNLSFEARTFREIFKQEIIKKSSKIDFNKINDLSPGNISKNKFILNLSPGFGEEDENTWPFEDINDFLDHLVFAVNIPNEFELGVIIQNDIGREFDFAATEFVYNNIFIKILNWLKSKGKGFKSCEDGKKLFDESKKTLRALGLTGFTWEYKSKIEKYNINFNLEATQALQIHEFLTHEAHCKQVLNVITKQNTLSAIKVYSILSSLPEYRKDYSYIFMNLDSIFNLQQYVIQSFGGDSYNLLVINCEFSEINISDFYSDLRDIIQSSKKKRIILITHENQSLANYFKYDFSIKEKYEEKIDDSNTFIDLTSEAQKKLLVEVKVLFQCKEIILGNLIDEESKYLIREDILFQLISDTIVQIGKPPSNLGEVEYYYIQRKFNRCVEISEKFLNKNSKFFITYNSEYINLYLKESLDIVLISASERDFYILCDKYKEKKRNIHWLKNEGKAFIWQRTRGSLSKLREFVNNEGIIVHEPQNITDVKEIMVIIAADAGMGKSTVLTFLAEQSKESDPALWIEKIDLVKHTEIINEINVYNNHTAIDCLLDIVNLKTSFERKLFKQKLNQRGKIALLFDGFDEISPYYKQKVFNLLDILRASTKVEKLWVTTRPHIKIEIEDQFGILSYDLQPLSKIEQETFLKMFLFKTLGSTTVNKIRLYDYTVKLLSLLSKSTSNVDEEKEFSGIPLHLKLLGEVFSDGFKEYHESSENNINLPEKLDLIDLYALFVKNKFDIYWKEKNENDWTKPSTKENYDKLYRLFILEHNIVALITLFSDHDVYDLLSAEEKETMEKFRESLRKGQERTGIVCVINQMTCFTHRSFAEYFAVEFISDKLKSISSAENLWNFLINVIFITDNQNVRKFFDNKLAIDHELATLGSKTTTKEIVLKLLQRDCEIRSFHIVAEENLVNILRFLLKFSTGNVDMNNRIINSNILSSVVSEGHRKVAEMFLSYVKDTDENKLCRMINIGSDLYDIPLQIAIQNNDQEMIDILLKYVQDTDDLEKIFNFCPSDYPALYYAVDDSYLADDHVLFKYIKKLNPDQRHRVIYYPCGPIEIDHKGRPLGPEMTPMYRAQELAEFQWDDQQSMNLSGLVHDTGDVLECSYLSLRSIIEKDYYPTKSITDLLQTLGLQERGFINYSLFKDRKKFLNFACDAALKYKPAYIDLVKCFVEEGADVNTFDNDNKTPLHLAAGKENGFKLVEYLITVGADINRFDNDGRTPLHYAAQYGKLEVVQYLVQKKADFTCIDKYGNTPLKLAEEKGRQQVMKFLKEKGAESHPVYSSAQQNLPKKRNHDEM